MSGALPGKRIGLGAVALLSPLTGIGRYTLELARGLREILDVPPHFFYGAGWSEDIRETPLPTFAKEAKEAVARFIPRPYVVSRLLMQRRFDRGARGIALYHEPNYVAFRFKGPTVVTVHDLSWVRYPRMHPPDRVRLMDSTMPRIVREAAHLIVDSDFTRSEVLQHYGVDAAKVTTVRLGVDPHFHVRPASQCASFLAQHGLEHGRYVLTVGTLEPRKNLSGAVRAHARLPQPLRQEFPLVVAGGAGWSMDVLPQPLQDALGRGEARLAGFVSQQDLPLLYAGARAFLYPSFYEGFGLPPLEAMASGVPAVVSNRASLPEIVGDAGVQVDPEEPEAIAAALRDLLEDDGRRATLSVHGVERAAGFSWARCVAATCKVYEAVLAR